MPCQAADRPARPAPLPHSGPDAAGTAAPTSPKPRRPPSSTAPPPPSGSIRPETSASCGPVATLPGSSICLHGEAENRTTRVLPNPDNPCATDRCPAAMLTGRWAAIEYVVSAARRGGTFHFERLPVLAWVGT